MNAFAIVLIALITQLAPSAQVPPAQAPSGVVEGVVVKLGTVDPISGANVELSRVDPVVLTPDPNARPGFPGAPPSPRVFRATTQEDGRFVLKELPAGTYRLVATRTGGMYTPAEFGQRDPKTRGTTFQLSSGQKLSDMKLAMAPTGSISGRISDGDDPIANARVMALEAAYRNGRRTLNVVQAVRSNDLGDYRLFWLRPGRYYIAVMREDLRGFSFAVHVVSPDHFGSREDASSPVVRERVLEDGTAIEETDLLMYYGGGFDEKKAQAIELLSGATVSAVDISVHDGKAQTRHVQGRVIGVNGQPAADAIVRLIPRQPAPQSLIPNATADKQGVFSISGVIPGSYFMFATVGAVRGFSFNETFLDASAGSSARIPIEITDRDLENLSVALKAPFSVPGRIYVEGTDQPNSTWDLTRARITLSRDPDLLGMPTAGAFGGPRPGQPASGVPDADGNFTLGGFGQGEYRLNVNAIPSVGYVKAVRLGGVDVLREGIQVEKNPDGQLDVLINLDGGRIEGTVVNEKAEFITNAIVVLVPDLPNRSTYYLYKVASTDTSGKFQMKGIAPGDYKVFAWESVEMGVWQDPDFLRTIEVRGKPVRFTDGSIQQLQVTVLSR